MNKKQIHYGRLGTGEKQKTLRSAYDIHLKKFLPENWSIGNFVASINGSIDEVTHVAKRPFVGVTPNAREELDKLVKFHLMKAQGK